MAAAFAIALAQRAGIQVGHNPGVTTGIAILAFGEMRGVPAILMTVALT
jgi:hypothetical protein